MTISIGVAVAIPDDDSLGANTKDAAAKDFEAQGSEVQGSEAQGIEINIEALINQADIALYLAKAAGRNCVRLYSGQAIRSAASLAGSSPFVET